MRYKDEEIEQSIEILKSVDKSECPPKSKLHANSMIVQIFY